MHTTPTDSPELLTLQTELRRQRLRLEVAMVRVQIKALESLERYMDDTEPTGESKEAKAEAIKRNRQRLAATQTLIHCRTADRRQRPAKSTRQPRSNRPGSEPARASVGSQTPEEDMPPATSTGGVVRSEADGHADTETRSTTPRALSPVADRAQPTPRKRPRYKARKPKHPRRAQRRKQSS